MDEIPSIQWFPGHMAKTRRIIKESLSLVDAVAEITDARIPAASRNPELDSIIGNKPRIVVLNKCDCADESAVKKWLEWYENNGITAVATDCKNGRGTEKFIAELKKMLKALLEKYDAKGCSGRSLRIMIVGIPNVGKSTFINCLAKQKKAKVENRPGVTLNKQWVRIDGNIDLLDMPGVLWPKFEDMAVGQKLAFTGAVKDDILDIEALAAGLLATLGKNYSDRLQERYKISVEPDDDGISLLRKVGKSRGMLVSGGKINTERAAITVLDEYRGGKLGRITLEFPNDM